MRDTPTEIISIECQESNGITTSEKSDNDICHRCGSRICHRHGSRIWSRGTQLLRLKVADVAKRSHASEASNLRPGSRARLRALEAFWVLMLKYAFSHILKTLFLSFLTSILTPNVDKNRVLEFLLQLI